MNGIGAEGDVRVGGTQVFPPDMDAAEFKRSMTCSCSYHDSVYRVCMG